MRALRDGQPDVLWAKLPASHRDDVTGLLRTAAAEADPELWREAFTLLERAANVIDAKRAWLASHPAFRFEPPAELGPDEAAPDFAADREAAWSHVANLLRTLATSELRDPTRVATLDVGDFLAGTGRNVMQELFAVAGDDVVGPFRENLRKIAVEPVSAENGRAVLRIGGGGYDRVEHVFVRVDDAWIPENLANEWDAAITAARSRVEGLDAAAGGSVRERLAAFDTMLDELEAADTEAAFHERLTAAVAALVPRPSPAVPEREPATGDDVVQVVVAGQLTPEEDERLQMLFNAAADAPELAIAISQRVGDETRFEVSHVVDVAAYAERLSADAAIDVTGVDEPARRVSVTYRR